MAAKATEQNTKNIERQEEEDLLAALIKHAGPSFRATLNPRMETAADRAIERRTVRLSGVIGEVPGDGRQ